MLKWSNKVWINSVLFNNHVKLIIIITLYHQILVVCMEHRGDIFQEFHDVSLLLRIDASWVCVFQSEFNVL